MENWMIILIAVATTFSLTVHFVVNKAEEKLSDKDDRIKEKDKTIHIKNNYLKEQDKQIDDLKNGKREYTEQEKKEWSKKQQEYKLKGKLYEEQIAKYYKDLGYEVDERGKRKGIKDKGIDLLIKKDDVYSLIQCKNYAPTTKVTEKPLRTFYGDCMAFVDKNNLCSDSTNFIFIISNEKSISKTAKSYINENKNFKLIVISTT